MGTPDWIFVSIQKQIGSMISWGRYNAGVYINISIPFITVSFNTDRGPGKKVFGFANQWNW